MTATRTEMDLLGSREVPVQAYYGIHTLRAVENFAISRQRISDLPDLVRGMALVKRAAALANHQLNVLPTDLTDAIVAACDDLLDGEHLDQFPVDVFQGGAGTSVNMNINEVVANLALEHMRLPKGRYDVIHPNDHVNKSQSTNDAYPTGLRLAAHASTGRLMDAVEQLAEAFETKAQQTADILKMGRTQLQDAVPMTLGQEFDGYAVTLGEELRSLRFSAALMLEVNLGATAIGTGVNTPKGYVDTVIDKLAQVTGLPATGAHHLVEATSDTGAYVHLHAAVKRVAVKLSKICNDLRLLSSGPRAGLGEIHLPEMQAGSSIMPAKVNPVIPEVVNQVCFKVIGNDVTVTMAAEAGQLQLNAMEPALAQAMFESLELITNACRVLTDRCVRGITANVDRCRAFVMNSIGLVTYLNEVIGHHQGDLVGREAARSGRTVREVVLEMGLLNETQLDDLLGVEALLSPTYRGTIYDTEVTAAAVRVV